MVEKRPRHYAAEIAALQTREQRQAALGKVQKELQELVKTHVEIYFFIKQHRG